MSYLHPSIHMTSNLYTFSPQWRLEDECEGEETRLSYSTSTISEDSSVLHGTNLSQQIKMKNNSNEMSFDKNYSLEINARRRLSFESTHTTVNSTTERPYSTITYHPSQGNSYINTKKSDLSNTVINGPNDRILDGLTPTKVDFKEDGSPEGRTRSNKWDIPTYSLSLNQKSGISPEIQEPPHNKHAGMMQQMDWTSPDNNDPCIETQKKNCSSSSKQKHYFTHRSSEMTYFNAHENKSKSHRKCSDECDSLPASPPRSMSLRTTSLRREYNAPAASFTEDSDDELFTKTFGKRHSISGNCNARRSLMAQTLQGDKPSTSDTVDSTYKNVAHNDNFNHHMTLNKATDAITLVNTQHTRERGIITAEEPSIVLSDDETSSILLELSKSSQALLGLSTPMSSPVNIHRNPNSASSQTSSNTSSVQTYPQETIDSVMKQDKYQSDSVENSPSTVRYSTSQYIPKHTNEQDPFDVVEQVEMLNQQMESDKAALQTFHTNKRKNNATNTNDDDTVIPNESRSNHSIQFSALDDIHTKDVANKKDEIISCMSHQKETTESQIMSYQNSDDMPTNSNQQVSTRDFIREEQPNLYTLHSIDAFNEEEGEHQRQIQSIDAFHKEDEEGHLQSIDACHKKDEEGHLQSIDAFHKEEEEGHLQSIDAFHKEDEEGHLQSIDAFHKEEEEHQREVRSIDAFKEDEDHIDLFDQNQGYQWRTLSSPSGNVTCSQSERQQHSCDNYPTAESDKQTSSDVTHTKYQTKHTMDASIHNAGKSHRARRVLVQSDTQNIVISMSKNDPQYIYSQACFNRKPIKKSTRRGRSQRPRRQQTLFSTSRKVYPSRSTERSISQSRSGRSSISQSRSKHRSISQPRSEHRSISQSRHRSTKKNPTKASHKVSVQRSSRRRPRSIAQLNARVARKQAFRTRSADACAGRPLQNPFQRKQAVRRTSQVPKTQDNLKMTHVEDGKRIQRKSKSNTKKLNRPQSTRQSISSRTQLIRSNVDLNGKQTRPEKDVPTYRFNASLATLSPRPNDHSVSSMKTKTAKLKQTSSRQYNSDHLHDNLIRTSQAKQSNSSNHYLTAQLNEPDALDKSLKHKQHQIRRQQKQSSQPSSQSSSQSSNQPSVRNQWPSQQTMPMLRTNYKQHIEHKKQQSNKQDNQTMVSRMKQAQSITTKNSKTSKDQTHSDIQVKSRISNTTIPFSQSELESRNETLGQQPVRPPMAPEQCIIQPEAIINSKLNQNKLFMRMDDSNHSVSDSSTVSTLSQRDLESDMATFNHNENLFQPRWQAIQPIPLKSLKSNGNRKKSAITNMSAIHSEQAMKPSNVLARPWRQASVPKEKNNLISNNENDSNKPVTRVYVRDCTWSVQGGLVDIRTNRRIRNKKSDPVERYSTLQRQNRKQRSIISGRK